MQFTLEEFEETRKKAEKARLHCDYIFSHGKKLEDTHLEGHKVNLGTLVQAEWSLITHITHTPSIYNAVQCISCAGPTDSVVQSLN